MKAESRYPKKIPISGKFLKNLSFMFNKFPSTATNSTVTAVTFDTFHTIIAQNYTIIKPARSAGFSRIKKIPYQAPPTQFGSQKCTFSKNAFLGPKYQC